MRLFSQGFLTRSRWYAQNINLCSQNATAQYRDLDENCGENCPGKDEKELAKMGMSYLSKKPAGSGSG